MLAIKFQRVGKRHQPIFRIVVSEKRVKMPSPPIEKVGWYNPLTKEFGINKERALYWISVGAKPTDTVHNFFVKNGVIKGPKIRIPIRKKKPSQKGATGETAASDTKDIENKAEEPKEKSLDESSDNGDVKTEQPSIREEKSDAQNNEEGQSKDSVVGKNEGQGKETEKSGAEESKS